MTPQELAYLNELAADIAAHGGLGDDPVAAVTAAHNRRCEFIMEMHDARTERAVMAREVLCAEIYGRCVHAQAIANTLERLDQRARDGHVRRMYQEFGL